MKSTHLKTVLSVNNYSGQYCIICIFLQRFSNSDPLQTIRFFHVLKVGVGANSLSPSHFFAFGDRTYSLEGKLGEHSRWDSNSVAQVIRFRRSNHARVRFCIVLLVEYTFFSLSNSVILLSNLCWNDAASRFNTSNCCGL